MQELLSVLGGSVTYRINSIIKRSVVVVVKMNASSLGHSSVGLYRLGGFRVLSKFKQIPLGDSLGVAV